jgi:hypothetical protein
MGMGFNNNYLFFPIDNEMFQENRDRSKHHLNCLVYGFEYIYNLYSSLVIPLIWENDNKDIFFRDRS